jgi:peptide/nickel transport system permease protein
MRSKYRLASARSFPYRGRPLAHFLIRRLGLSLLTLLLLSVLVFALAHLLPGDVGRAVLGPLASDSQVVTYDQQHGLDRAFYVQYLSWIGNFVRGNMGTSLQYSGSSVWGLLEPAFVNSLKLAGVAFLLVVPISIIGGTIAALTQGRLTDRVITITGLSLTAVPEFVTAIVLIAVFGVALGWLPTTAHAPSGSGPLTELKYLLLPAFALVMVLFGYIARMARAGVIEALDADYTRTAYLKGLGLFTVLRRHVLRNALLPTIAVIATQTGYLIGGLLVIEKLFNYPGIGQRIYTAAQNKDFTILQSGVLLIGLVYLAATLLADVIYVFLNPRIRYGGGK